MNPPPCGLGTPCQHTSIRDNPGHPGSLLERFGKRIPTKWIARLGRHADNKIIPTGGCNAHLYSELIFLVDFALSDTFDFRGVDTVQLVFILLLLIKHAFRQLEFLMELSMQIGIIQDVSQNVPIHSAKERLSIGSLSWRA